MFVGELGKGTLIVAIAFVSRLLRVSRGGHGFGPVSFPDIPLCPSLWDKKIPLRMILYIFYHLLYSEGQVVK